MPTDHDLLLEYQESMKSFLVGAAEDNRRLRRRNRFFRNEINRLIAAQVQPGSRVADVGCADGETLAALQPSTSLGIDPDELAIDEALARHPDLDFQRAFLHEIANDCSEQFDYVVAAGLLEHTFDVYETLRDLSKLCDDSGRLVLVTYSRLWQPVFKLAERMGLKAAFPTQNWIPVSELNNLAEQVDLEVVRSNPAILIPFRIPAISRWVNRWVAPLPLVRHLNFVHMTVLRKQVKALAAEKVSVVIPARNESGHIARILDRLPLLAPEQEVIFVEGNSTDETWVTIKEECEARRDSYHSTLKWFQQPGAGKGDAVRFGFEMATGDVLIILDADISVPPEELSKFVAVIANGKAEFANGSRLVYDMEGGAMRFLNLLGNRFFGMLFSFLLGQPVRDTLCGTKVLNRCNYERIAANREHFGEFDPFGDFDLLFGAAYLNLRIRDVPVHYRARTYGDTNISRFRHGAILLKMSWVAARRIRFV